MWWFRITYILNIFIGIETHATHFIIQICWFHMEWLITITPKYSGWIEVYGLDRNTPLILCQCVLNTHPYIFRYITPIVSQIPTSFLINSKLLTLLLAGNWKNHPIMTSTERISFVINISQTLTNLMTTG